MKQDKIGQQIHECVASYRRAQRNLQEVKIPSPTWTRACEMMMDRASGALDVLYTLAPNHRAWKDSEWTF